MPQIIYLQFYKCMKTLVINLKTCEEVCSYSQNSILDYKIKNS